MSATTNYSSKTQQWSRERSLVDSSSTHFEALPAVVSRRVDDDASPTYINYNMTRRPAVCDDYKLQLMPLDSTHHHAISAYQHQLQQHQPSDYTKTEKTTSEQSDSQGN